MAGDQVTCSRCNRTAKRLDQAPIPGPNGEEILGKVCSDCWAEWQKAEVMVINELRLNFMDPRAQEVLMHHMKEFLFFGGAVPQLEGEAPEAATGPATDPEAGPDTGTDTD